jgi:hypothetical protein
VEAAGAGGACAVDRAEGEGGDEAAGCGAVVEGTGGLARFVDGAAGAGGACAGEDAEGGGAAGEGDGGTDAIAGDGAPPAESSLTGEGGPSPPALGGTFAKLRSPRGASSAQTPAAHATITVART